ncbi:MAG: hypothetical protein ACFBQW_06660 [Sphingomonadaceae bacterium]
MIRSAAIASALVLAACGEESAPPPEPAAPETRAPEPVASEPGETRRYENERYRFAIDVPGFMRAEEAPQNLDGRVFVDPASGAELSISASHNALKRSFKTQIETASEGLREIEGEIDGDYGFRATGIDEEGRRVHLRLVRPGEGRLVSASFRYPPDEAERMAPIAERALASLVVMQQVGPLSIAYDPFAFAQTDAEIAIPPDWEREVRGLKLVAREREKLLGKAECIYGESGRATTCNAEQEAGLEFALIDQAYEELRAALPAQDLEPTRLAGREGVAWKIGAEGAGADRHLKPAG